jgi:hypothetical protein
MGDDVKAFVASCLHCLATVGGVKVPRPLVRALRASKASELLHFDNLYTGESFSNLLYKLILKDDLSGYVRLYASSSADAGHTAESLMDWFVTFGVVRSWVSDKGHHLKNQLITALVEM